MSGGSKSKTKGSTFERDLGKFLGETFEGSFIRSANSGAFVGGQNSARKATLSKGQVTSLKGDLVSPDHMPRLVVEAKFYSEFRFHQLLQPGPVAQLDAWIAQCLDAVDPDDFWVIVFKINLRGTFVVVPEAAAAGLVFGNHCLYHGERGSFWISDMKSFFVANKDEILRKSAAKPSEDPAA